MLLATLFMVLLVGTTSLFAAFVCLVTFSLCIYTLIISRGNSPRLREAGLKYFFLSTISALFFLLSVIILMYCFKTTDYAEIQEQLLAVATESRTALLKESPPPHHFTTIKTNDALLKATCGVDPTDERYFTRWGVLNFLTALG